MKKNILLYFIPAKGLGDIIVRLHSIYSLLSHYKKIYIVCHKSIFKILDFYIFSSNVEYVNINEFINNRSKYISFVDTIVYSSRDHSLLGFIRYFR